MIDGEILMNKERISRSLTRMAYEILEMNRGTGDLAIIGIRTRGVFLAQRLVKIMKALEGQDVLFGILDITLYRDDLTTVGHQAVVRKTEIPFPITGKHVILVDDVLFTGRTVRAALDAVIDLGRPRFIRLAVLIDRGHREFPIQADFIGDKFPSSPREVVKVFLQETDGKDLVVLTSDPQKNMPVKGGQSDF